MNSSYFEYYEKAFFLPALDKVEAPSSINIATPVRKQQDTRYKYRSPCIAKIQPQNVQVNISEEVGNVGYLGNVIAVHDLACYRRKKSMVRVLPSIITLLDLIAERSKNLGDEDTALSLKSYLER